jgi:hypothetical protein
VQLGAGCAQQPNCNNARVRARSLDCIDISPLSLCTLRCARAPRRRPRSHRGGRLCAEFVLGALDTNVCPTGPSGWSKIGPAACSTAAEAFGRSYVSSGIADASYPSGCFGYDSTYLRFNAHPTGAPHPNAQPLCAGAPTPHRRSRVFACARARVRACMWV